MGAMGVRGEARAMLERIGTRVYAGELAWRTLRAGLDAAKDLCHEYNSLSPSQRAEQRELLAEICGSVGRGVHMEQPLRVDYGFNVHIGDGCYFNHDQIILDPSPVVFGERVYVGPGCIFSTAAHAIDPGERGLGYEYSEPIEIGNDVWIGARVTVLPGVSIGSGSVIGAGSIVTRDVPSGVVAVGNPCRVLREVTEADRDSREFVGF